MRRRFDNLSLLVFIKTVQNYMSVARFAGKNENVFVFSGLDPSALYRLAALPDEKAATLTPDTLLQFLAHD